jgi:uncharacterized membrane protein
MASRLNDFFGKRGTRYDKSIAPDALEKILGVLALVLLGFAMTAVIKGQHQWHLMPWQLWAHLGTLLLVLAITPLMLWRKRGDAMHRLFGWIWAIGMFSTAMVSFDIRWINDGGFSLIHILSVMTVIGVPVLILSARRRDFGRHRGQVRGFVIGALLVAGFFTFPFNRLLGSWLFG